MENWNDLYAGRKCTCDHYAPHELVLRSKEYIRALAAYLAALDMSADEIAVWLVYMLLVVHQDPGKLYKHNGQVAELREDAKVFDGYLHHEDLRSCIKRIVAWSRVQRQRRLRKEAVPIVEALTWAVMIHQCVTDGPCSKR